MKKVPRATAIETLVIILVTALLLALCYPAGQSHFRYKYTLGQPWNYQEKLIAKYDFEVRKSPEAVRQEKEAIERDKDLYFDYKRDLYGEQKERLVAAYHEENLPRELLEHSSYVSYLLKALEQVYRDGMIDRDSLVAQGDSVIYLIGKDNVARRRQVAELTTPAEAYDQIVTGAPEGLDSVTLRRAGLAKLLQPNIVFNEERTSQMLDARLSSIDEVLGVVRKGSKIVDQGDPITPETYQKLQGYEKVYNRYAESTTDRVVTKLGLFVLFGGVLLLLHFYLLSRPKLIEDRKTSIFLLLQVLFFPAVTYLLTPSYPATVYLLPYCMVLILTESVLDQRTAFVTFVTTVLLSAVVTSDTVFFLLLEGVSGMVVLATMREMTQRRDLITAAAWVPLTQIVTYVVYLLAMDGDLAGFDRNMLWYFCLSFVFLMFSYPLLYIVEKVFGFVTPLSLMELGDISKPLLKRENEVAPGTFQHVLNVSILSTAAVEKIGGDVQLTRVGALYHDIGKMKNPIYFTENQGTENNPHFKLKPEESARIVISHVTDGVEMARKANLPEQVIDFIRTHHGLGMTKYFYIQYRNEHPDEVVDESLFHYPGPNPWTREQGVLMLADQVEASSRSLKEINEEILSNHIDKIVDGVVSAGYLRNTPLTLKDIEMVKQVFLDRLRTMNHSRIKYPELKSEAEGDRKA